jgi:hypothetical protein
MNPTSKHESALRTYLWIGAMVGIILAKGFFSYFGVADRGQPAWDYRPVRDLPSQSPYAVYPPLPYPQHVRGLKGE